MLQTFKLNLLTELSITALKACVGITTFVSMEFSL